jgi:NTE family protein
VGLFDFLGLKKKRLGIALGGGGARGIAHIAFLKVLDELNLRPAVISGTSMGALIGALYASGHTGVDIERIFKELNWRDILSLMDFSWLHVKEGLIQGEKISRFLAKLTQNKRIEELDIPLRIVAADYWKQQEVVFKAGNLAEAVRASISLPGIFEPVVADQRVLVDGGVVNSLPYELIRGECDVLVAVNVIGEKLPEGKGVRKPGIFEAFFSTFQMMEAANIENKLKQSRPDYYIKPRLTNIELLDFQQMNKILTSVEPDAVEFKKFLEKTLNL